jgi:formylglycine-generating enzyme required for sulfatase activity
VPANCPFVHIDSNEVHEVYLDRYQIGRYPVTVAEYKRFVDQNGYDNECWWRAGGFGHTNEPEGWEEQLLHLNRPVVSVSWYEATAYCAWKGVRLPTEAKWEFAARGKNARKYPWGSEEPDATRANHYYEGAVRHPTPVGLYPRAATPDGIEDLAGNVAELVAGWYTEGYHAKPSHADPKDAEPGRPRVIRGETIGDTARGLRAAYRNGQRPERRHHHVGFRCARKVLP